MKTLPTLLLVLALLPAMMITPALHAEEKTPMTEGETQAWLKIAELNLKVKALQDQIAKDKTAQECLEAADTAKALEILRRTQQDLTADSELFTTAKAIRKAAQENADHFLHYVSRDAASLVPIAQIILMQSDLDYYADKQKTLEAENAELKQKLSSAGNENYRLNAVLERSQSVAEAAKADAALAEARASKNAALAQKNYNAAMTAQQQAAAARTLPPPIIYGRPVSSPDRDYAGEAQRKSMELDIAEQTRILRQLQIDQSLKR